nr:hypothetical protein [Tanacetum cinerariifolium]
MMNKNFSEMMRQFQTIKAVDMKCETCGGPHSFTECPAVDGYNQETAYATTGNYNSGGTGSLPSITVLNPREDLKAITPSPASTSFSNNYSSKIPEVIKDTVQPSTKNIQPPMAQKQNPIYEPVVALKPKPTIPYPSGVNKQKLHEKDDNLALKFVEIFRNLDFELSFAKALLHMAKFALMFKSLLNNKEKLFDLATTTVNENYSTVILKKLSEKLGDPDAYNEELTLRVDDEVITFKEYVQEVLEFSDNSKSGNPILISNPIIALSSPLLTPFEGGNFILEKIEACLTSESIPPGIDDTDLDLEGDIRLLEELLNNDPSLSPLPQRELNVEEIKTIKSSIDEPSELELKELLSH